MDRIQSINAEVSAAKSRLVREDYRKKTSIVQAFYRHRHIVEDLELIGIVTVRYVLRKRIIAIEENRLVPEQLPLDDPTDYVVRAKVCFLYAGGLL